jgi:predicted DCC family thiol-disulfide oxidoreductase YuxK
MEEQPIILFDGVCNFCNDAVNFIIHQDKKGMFKFASLQSSKGQELIQKYGLPSSNFNSFILIENGKVYKRSTAGLRLYNKLPWYWKWTQVFWVVPSFLRDAVYDLIALNRYKWFGKKYSCMMPTPEIKNRFLS